MLKLSQLDRVLRFQHAVSPDRQSDNLYFHDHAENPQLKGVLAVVMDNLATHQQRVAEALAQPASGAFAEVAGKDGKQSGIRFSIKPDEKTGEPRCDGTSVMWTDTPLTTPVALAEAREMIGQLCAGQRVWVKEGFQPLASRSYELMSRGRELLANTSTAQAAAYLQGTAYLNTVTTALQGLFLQQDGAALPRRYLLPPEGDGSDKPTTFRRWALVLGRPDLSVTPR